MLLHWTLILFIIGFLACIYAVATILNYTAIPYQVGVVILVAIIIATTFCYGFFQIYRINKDPRKNESYKLKNADFNIRFEDGKTANIEHILKLHKNRKNLNPQEKIIRYTFYELGEISDVSVAIDSQPYGNNSSESPNTFSLKSDEGENTITIYPSDIAKNDFELKISYLIKNPLSSTDESPFTYANSFLAERNGFSYNTNFKGTINFSLPKGSVFDVVSVVPDLYIQEKSRDEDGVSIYFENKFNDDVYFGSWWLIRRNYHLKETVRKDEKRQSIYDTIDDKGEYSKDFSILTRLDFVSPNLVDTYVPPLKMKLNSIEDLKITSNKLNSRYNDVVTGINFLLYSLISPFLIFLILSLEYIRSYVTKKQLEEEFGDELYEGYQEQNDYDDEYYDETSD